MILLLDNYDSFVFNLEQGFASLGAQVVTVRNDSLSVTEALALRPSALVLSPGPGRPADAGILPELLQRVPADLPLLGVCLGHQALVEACGGRLARDGSPVHGRAMPVHHTRGSGQGRGLFEGLPSPMVCGRYHSLYAERDSLPESLELTAWTEDGVVMAVQHRARPHYGVQFHPESILTPLGARLLARFMALAGLPVAVERGGRDGR